jgi:methyl-accepting chemotaxis protein
MQWFKNLNAAPRLLMSFGALVVIMVAICLLAIHNLGEANQRLAAMYQQDMAGAVHADNIAIARMELGRSGRNAILNMESAAIVATDKKTMLSDFETIHSNLDAAEQVFSSTAGKDALDAIRDALPAYEKAYHDLFARVAARDMEGSRAALLTVNDAGAPLYAAADTARNNKENRAAEKFALSEASYQTARTIMLCLTVFAAVLGALLAFMIARSFSIPLALAVNSLERVAAGDLTVTLAVGSKDELGRMAEALNDAVDKLGTTLRDVSENAAAASASSQQLAAAADAIASGAQQQAASLEETSASLEQITAAVRQSADNAKQASQVASGSRDSAERGQQVVADAVTAMAEINVASAKISDIISTIDEIAFQTNLLAVNAAVEAARAGEEGRGFAVVATEVRSLAQRSAGAAKEIKALIQDSLRKVERGTELVNKSGETLRSIVGSVKGVTDIVNEIAAAAAEQSTGVEQVNMAMTQMDRVTQSNAAQTEQLSSTAQALSEQSLRLTELVGTFVLGQQAKQSRGSLTTTRNTAATRHMLPVRSRPGVRSVAASARGANGAVVQPSGRPGTVMTVAAAGSDEDDSFEEF